jgi:hypothetical protein
VVSSPSITQFVLFIETTMFHSLSKEVTFNLSRRIAFPFTFLLVESLVLYLFTSFQKEQQKFFFFTTKQQHQEEERRRKKKVKTKKIK